jgi:epoxyqueuosine reductase
MNSRLSNEIKAKAQSLGFSACGIAMADAVDSSEKERFWQWLHAEGEAGMTYMANYTDKRLDPRLLVPGVKSIVSVALNYATQHQASNGYNIAAYALGKDYHDVMKQMLSRLYKEVFDHDYSYDIPGTRIFVDSGPVLERYWAVKAGLGWLGRNHQLIIPHAGSMFFIGELFLPVELKYDKPMQNRCGACHKCEEACPTKALHTNPFNAEKCLSYQLIENRNSLSPEACNTMGNTIYGCDRCQTACPWNHFATPTVIPELQPNAELLQMNKRDWQQLTREQYTRLFRGSAIKRVKYDGLMRNINAAKENERRKKTESEYTSEKQ